MIQVSKRIDSTLVTQCSSCNLEFVNPLLDEAVLRKTYEIQNHPDAATTRYVEGYIKEREERHESYSRVYGKRLALIERFYPEKGKILDIGCAAGFFLHTARKRGWEPYGVDLVPFLLDYGRNKLQLENLYLDKGDDVGHGFPPMDVITLWDLIEHLRNPVETLQELNKSLKDNGLLVIWTPNVRNATYMKSEWNGYHILQHLYFFSPETLGALLKQTGYEVVYMKTDHTKKAFFPDWCFPKWGKKPQNLLGKTLYSIRRDLGNLLNPCNLISPLLDKMGYGFNLYVIARKVSGPSEFTEND